MTEVISVRFKNGGKTYFFAPGGKTVKAGAKVIVETSKGLELAECRYGNHMVEDSAVVQPLRPLIRIATDDDLRIAQINRKREKEAFEICQQKIAEHELEMKLVDVECSFDGNKTTFFFTSDSRVDFRELVKDLAAIFRNRIELRQIGVRDEAKMLGGLGICGRPFCCSRFIDDFLPVSTKMAKAQSMSLNPSKISGSCGRLMCCLRYEQEAYEELIKTVPKMGAFVETPAGYGDVTQVNLLRQLVKVKLDGDGDDTVKTYKASEIAAVPGGRPKDGETPPSVLVRLPAAEQEDEADRWELPVPEFISADNNAPEKKEPSKKSGRRRHKSGKKPPRPEENKAPREEKAVVKAKPKPKNTGSKPQANNNAPKAEKQHASAEVKPQPKNTEKTGGAKHGRRRYYHHGKPKNKTSE